MSLLPHLGELRRYRYLLRNLVARDLKARYKGSVLGFLWTVLHPLLVMLVFTVIFSHIVRIQVEKFPVFLLCGLFPWSFFSVSLVNGAGSVLGASTLIKKVYFPQELFPLSAVLSNLVNYLLSLGILFGFLIAFRVPLGPELFLLPVVLALHLSFTYGLSLVLACANVFYRDVQQILEVVLLAWFYATPVFYPVSMVPEGALRLYLANPMAAYVSLYRWMLFDHSPPAGTFPYVWGVAVVGAAAAFLLGHALFDARKHRFAEVI